MKLRQLLANHYELLIWLGIAFCSTAVFWFTDLDIKSARLFYHPENIQDVWPERNGWLWHILFEYAFEFTICAGLIALGCFALSYVVNSLRHFRRAALYILLVIMIGPGLVVNLIVKDHWGRPRPMHIKEFGGQFDYIPPVQLGTTSDKSFVCGHCSVGYSFFVLYFLAKNYKPLYFCLTLLLAWTLGITRMTSGGHFLSDIIWSGLLVFLVAYLLYHGWYIRNRLNPRD